jgi:hypothetical protein
MYLGDSLTRSRKDAKTREERSKSNDGDLCYVLQSQEANRLAEKVMTEGAREKFGVRRQRRRFGFTSMFGVL